MDRFATAQARLFAAFDRLETAVASHRAREARLLQDKAALEEALANVSQERMVPRAEHDETGQGAANMIDLEQVRAENAALKAAKAEAADRLDAALERLKTLLAS